MCTVDIFGGTIESDIEELLNRGVRIIETLDMHGFKAINCSNPDDPNDVANKAYVDSKLGSTWGTGDVTKLYVDTNDNLRVLKTGDVMTGDLLFSSASSNAPAMHLGCNDLVSGQGFGVLIGSVFNQLSYLNSPTSNPIIVSTTNGCLFKLDTNDIMKVGTSATDKKIITYQQLQLNSTIDANNNKILNLTTPTASTDASTKGYVDSKRVKNNSGYIPVLTSNGLNRCGIIVSASSEASTSYQAWKAFTDSAPTVDNVTWQAWACANLTANYWLKVELPYAIRIWKFSVSPKGNDVFINSWRVEGSNNDSTWTSLYSSTTMLECMRFFPTYYEFALTTLPTIDYKYYRFYVVSSSGVNAGLIHFQLYSLDNIVW